MCHAGKLLAVVLRLCNCTNARCVIVAPPVFTVGLSPRTQRIYVGNLPDRTTARGVNNLVRQFGWVVSVEVKTSRHCTGLLSWSLTTRTAVMPFLAGRHSQSALFPDHRSCRKAIERLSGHEGHGCRLRVQMSRGHRDPFGRRGASSPERYVCLFRARS